MFEREVKFIYDFNSNKVKKLGATATYVELLPLGIHPAILQYIAAEIEYRVFEDRQTLLKHSMFDYSGPEISKHFGKIADEIKKEKHFSTDFLSKVILHATSFNVNYLIRPNWSLKKLIFDASESNSVAEITQILSYTYFYKHLTKVIKNFLDKKKLITLSKDEFAELLTKFDNVSMQSYGKDIIDSAIKSMASFFNIGSMNQKSVPVQAIGVFLKEKKLVSHLEILQRKLTDENKNKIEVNDLKNLFLNQPIENFEFYEPEKKIDEEVKITEVEETIQPQRIEDNFEEVQPETEEKIKDEVQEKLIEDDKEPEPVEDDVEIKLRANKEKEVADTQENIEEDETTVVSKPEEETLDPMDYLGDQGNDGTDIILTVDDLEENGIEVFEEKPEHELPNEPDDTFETGEVIDLEAESNETGLNEEELPVEKIKTNIKENTDAEELELSDEEDEHELVIEDLVEYEMSSPPENEYSYPEPREAILTADDNEETDNHNDESGNSEKENDDDSIIDEAIDLDEKNTPQTTLFGEISGDDLIEDSDDDSFLHEFGTPNFSKRIDIADLLENRNMTKIIEVVFDYDMEEFANSIERICESSNRQEAFGTLQEIFEVNQVNPTSKEAQAFRDIISEYFDQS